MDMTLDDVWLYVERFAPLVLSVLLALINLITRGRYKNILKELSMLSYRSATYRTNPDDIPNGSVFSNLIPQFRLNKVTGLLEESEPLDITALVNSARDVELKQLLSRLESGNAELSETVREQYEDYREKLDILSNAHETALNLAEQFGMNPEDVSISSVLKRLDDETNKLQQQQKLINNQQEVIHNAQENVAQAQQASVQEHGKTSTQA